MLYESAVSTMLAFGLPGHWEWVILLVLGLLIFGRRLPEVGRNIGRSIVEFKKGIKGVTDEIEDESSRSSSSSAAKRLDSEVHREPLPSETMKQVSEGDSPGRADRGTVAANHGEQR